MIGRNFWVGVGGSVWNAALGFAVVPIYLHYLGEESFGLVGALAAIQGLFLLLDLGLSQTINREVARHSSLGQAANARPLLHTLATIYWSIAVAIGLTIVAFSGAIAGHWLHFDDLSTTTVRRAVMMIGLVVAGRWPVGLYTGAVLGAERFVTATTINTAASTLSNGGSVLVLLVTPTIEALFAWQAGVGLLHALAMRHAAWRALSGSARKSFDLAALQPVWKFSGAAATITAMGVLLTQIDKLILSNLLSLAEFGRYALAGVVARVIQLFLTPLFNAIYPRFSALVANGEHDELRRLYRRGTNWFACLVFPLAMAMAIIPKSLVQAWTRDPALATSVGPAVSLIAVATALNGMMFFPYALQLAYGRTDLPLKINAFLVVVLVPLTVSLTLGMGMVGGALASLCLNVLYLLVGGWFTHRYLLKGIGAGWLSNDVGRPLAISLLFGAVLTRYRIDSLPGVWPLVLSSLCFFVGVVLCALSSPHATRRELSGLLGRRRGS